ncbi:MAG: NAD(P)/FAD-dependent oxidoreductase, partial [Lachnospiraceae bacterium]|nr:NAD(P)/FAD-dependent oxidoreductase [Lachnospiraceae bacterium]
MKKIAVIGGGAAGMMAAITDAQNGAEVILLEKNEKLGKKLFITGKGRCNLTNTCENEEFFSHVVSNPKFLYSSIYDFDHFAVMEMIEKLGCPLKEERG